MKGKPINPLCLNHPRRGCRLGGEDGPCCLLGHVPATIISGIISPVQNVSAAGECEGDVFSEPNWNRTVDRHAKIPSVYDDIYLEDYQEKGLTMMTTMSP